MTEVISGIPAQAAPAFLSRLLNSRVRFSPEPEGAPTTPPATPPATPAAATPPAAAAPATPPVTPAAEPPKVVAPATPPAAAPATPPVTPTALTSEPTPPAGSWPDNWVDIYAKGNDETKKRLARYASPEAAFDALFAAQNKIRSGEIKPQAPGKDAKPEEIAQWRKDNGIPETAAGYTSMLPEGLTLNVADKTMIDAFAERMHAKNAPPELVHEAMAWYYQTQAQNIEQQKESDATAKQKALNTLETEWGPDAKRNKNLLKSFLGIDQANTVTGSMYVPKEVSEAIMGGRAADGTPLGSHPPTLRWLTSMYMEHINPAATVVPGIGPTATSAIADEISAWETKMGDKHSDYWKGPAAEKNQARYRELITARDKMEARNTRAA